MAILLARAAAILRTPPTTLVANLTILLITLVVTMDLPSSIILMALNRLEVRVQNLLDTLAMGPTTRRDLEMSCRSTMEMVPSILRKGTRMATPPLPLDRAVLSSLGPRP